MHVMRDSMFFDDVLMRHCVIFCFIFVYKSDSNEKTDPNKKDPAALGGTLPTYRSPSCFPRSAA